MTVTRRTGQVTRVGIAEEAMVEVIGTETGHETTRVNNAAQTVGNSTQTAATVVTQTGVGTMEVAVVA